MNRIAKYFPVISVASENQIDLFSITRLRSFFLAFLQFCLILYIVAKYHFEKTSGIIDYSLFVLIVFVLHSFIPIRFRPAFLFLSCITLMYFAFGILASSFMTMIGLGFIFICHLPIKFSFRFFIVITIALLMALFRTEFFYVPWMTMVAMYIMPLFMFRLIIYLYEIKNGLVPANKWQSVLYFFMFPNIFFLFFPIVDYKTSIKSYYDVPEKDIWQKGIRWMLRGLIHILCYRLISFNLLISQESIQDLPSLLHYVVANYSLILRLSGIFHFIVGLICMFGFNLPQVFDNYFTATSFVDLWRRINIYWRNFVLKIFFYPTMFRYKKRIKKNLLPITMMTVFVITWLLHSYQLFWITGGISIKLIDAVFWITIGACITTNSVIIEKRSLSGKIDTINKNGTPYAFISMLRMVGMLLFMSIMWSLWKSKTIEDWLFIISKGKIFTANQIVALLIIFISIILLGVIVKAALKKSFIKNLINKKPHETIGLTAFSLLLLTLLSFKEVQTRLPLTAQNLVSNLMNSSPNLIEKGNVEIGYYDRLIEGEEENTIGIGGKSFKTFISKKPYVNAYYLTNDIMYRRMKPNLKIDGIDHNFQSNSFGIRDKEYSIKKAPGANRLALLGGSYQMGSGVNNDEVFETIAEVKLNKEMVDSLNTQYELLNFAAGGYYLLQQVELINTTVFKYDVDGVIYFAHTDEREKAVHFFANLIKRQLPLNYPFLNKIKESSGAKAYMSVMQIKELLLPYGDDIVKWGYKEISEKCKANHVIPIWAYMETTTEYVDNDEYYELKAYVESLGFVTLDLRNTYGKIDRKEVQLSEWNTHPNVLGHRIIADRFYKELVKNKKRIFKTAK